MSVVENQFTQLVKPKKLPAKPRVHGKILCLSLMAYVAIVVLSIKGSGTWKTCRNTESRTVLIPAEFQGELDMTRKPPLDIGQCKVLAPWHQAHCLNIPLAASGFLIHD